MCSHVCTGLKCCLLFVLNASPKSQGLCSTTDYIKAKNQQYGNKMKREREVGENIYFNFLKSPWEEIELRKYFNF